MLAMAPVGTGQQKNEDGGKQNGGSCLYYLKMTSFMKLSEWLMAKKIPLLNNRENLGNVLCQGKTFFPAEC